MSMAMGRLSPALTSDAISSHKIYKSFSLIFLFNFNLSNILTLPPHILFNSSKDVMPFFNNSIPL